LAYVVPPLCTHSFCVPCLAGSASSRKGNPRSGSRSEEHTSELQSPCNLVCRLLLEKKNAEYRRGVELRAPGGCRSVGPFEQRSVAYLSSADTLSRTVWPGRPPAPARRSLVLPVVRI